MTLKSKAKKKKKKIQIMRSEQKLRYKPILSPGLCLVRTHSLKAHQCMLYNSRE